MQGDGMVSLGVRVVADFRNVKASTKIGSGRVTRLGILRSGREEEVHVPGLPAHLAVGDPLKTRVLLELHAVADRGVLGGAELGGAHLAGLPLEAERLERGRAQQAANVIGAERRARISHGAPGRYFAPVGARMLPRCSRTWLIRIPSIACVAVMAGMPASTLALRSSSASLSPRTRALVFSPFAPKGARVSALARPAGALPHIG